MKLKDLSREYMEEFANTAFSDFWDALREDLEYNHHAVMKLSDGTDLMFWRSDGDKFTLATPFDTLEFIPICSVSVDVFRPLIPMDDLLEFLGNLEYEDLRFNVISWIYMYLKTKAVKIEAYI